MCGIVGAMAQRDVAAVLLEGLRRLEYRGYDSAGLSVVNPEGTLHTLRRVGKVAELAEALQAQPLLGGVGIAHTRWATHGQPSELNAHPHTSNTMVVVHNGIIENHEPLRQQLQQQGYRFESETDTEVIAHLIAELRPQHSSLLATVLAARQQLHGAYGMAIIDSADPSVLVVARSGSPLVIGRGIGENFVASDPLALLPVTQQFQYLEEGDVAAISRTEVTILDAEGQVVERPIEESALQHDAADKAGYRHYMLKEIHEQPDVLRQTLEGRLQGDAVVPEIFGAGSVEVLMGVQAVQIIACGTSYHAGMVARYWFEEQVGIPCQVEIASEFRYRTPVVLPNTLLVTISQSGETADTLAALRLAKQLGYAGSLTICNAPGSSLVRESDLAYMMRAGTEIGVASTKAFTAQLVGLLLLVLVLRQLRGQPVADAVAQLRAMPQQVAAALTMEPQIAHLAERFADKHNALFLGRGSQYPIAMEGALKLKEISYIHAEAYAAGELKHGPLALIDDTMPTIVVAPNNELLEKLKSNMEEVRARGGELIVFADTDAGIAAQDGMTVLGVPPTTNLVAPMVYTVPLQLLSYHVALIIGTDVDQPRNLAKSVTVE